MGATCYRPTYPTQQKDSIMSEYEFDTAYSAVTGEHVGGLYVPTVEQDSDAVHGVLIDGAPRTTAIQHPGVWYALTGYTRQHGYRGAVMHPSETMGDAAIREAVIEAGGDVFAIVEVGDGAPCDGEDCYCGPAVGWAVVYRAVAS